MPRPNRSREKLTVNLSPDTIQAVKQLAHEQQTYPGDIIDQAVKEMTMQSWTLKPNGPGADRSLKGTTLDEAIIRNFRAVAEAGNIGNGAGYTLERVHVAYAPGILGGKGGAEVTITSRGRRLAHRDTEPAAATTSVWIYAKPEDCPEPHDLPIDEA